MVKNLTAQTHHFNARYETDTRSALRNIEQLQTQLTSEAARHQADVARVDELAAENNHYKSVNKAMKMEAQEYFIKVKLDVASAAFEHRKAMDACATTVSSVQERFDRLEADFNALYSASESEAVLAITRSRDELRTQLDAVDENVRELTRQLLPAQAL